MLERLFRDERAIIRHREGRFGGCIDAFTEHLKSQGYVVAAIRQKVPTVSGFGRWLDEHGLSTDEISEKTIAKYCRKRRNRNFIRHGGEATLRALLGHLRSAGVVPVTKAPLPEGAFACIEHDFERHLRKERALSEATVTNYCPVAKMFLSERFGKKTLDLTQISVADIHAFVFRHAHDYSPKRVQLMLTALRSFLRFLHLHGKIPVALNEHVPSAPKWRRTEPPKWLNADSIEQILKSCNCQSAIGQRDFAVLLLLARLGLRAGEVVSLELENIRWETGQITVCGKGKQRKCFPVPEDVGQALATYLKNVRPSCSSRRVFLRTRAPYRGFGSSATVDTIVCKALRRAGLDPPCKGAHLFRHSLATNMLRTGATLTEIGQVLHHTSPNTTSIYAKVDLEGLRTLAQPWPED